MQAEQNTEQKPHGAEQETEHAVFGNNGLKNYSEFCGVKRQKSN